MLPPGLERGKALAEDEAVKIALWNNPVFQANLSRLGFSRADLLQAGALSNPNLSMLFPWGPKQFEFTATFPLEAIYLRPQRVRAARIEAERVAESLLQSGLDLIRDVRIAFTDLSLAQERSRLNFQAVEVRETLLKIATARERLGEGTALELVAARAEARRAAEEKRRSDHEISLAQERLKLLTGLPEYSEEIRIRPTAIEMNAIGTSTNLETRALAARPDLRGSELAMEAAAARAGLAKKEIFLLSGVIDANASGSEGFEIGPGAQLSIPILNQNQSGRARANAELERAAWNYAATRQRILFEVRDALLKFQQASEALQAFRSEILPPARELAERSRRAYEIGEIEPMVAQEFARQWITSRVAEADLIAALQRARAELERSIGTRLGPAANPL